MRSLWLVRSGSRKIQVMRAWNVLRQLLAATLCAVLALPACSNAAPLNSSTPSHIYDAATLSKTRVWGSNQKILLHFRAVGQLSGKQHWGCENSSWKTVVGSGVTYDYDAFGNLIHSTGATFNEFLFAGEQFDSDLGLYYNRARYLNVSTGRFWTMDAFEGDAQSPLSLHKFTYAGGDPINEVDPTGRDFTLGSISITTGIQQTVFGLSVLQTQALVQGIFGAAVGAFAAAASGAAGGASAAEIDAAIQKNIFWGFLLGAGGTAVAALRIGRLVLAAVSVGLGGSASYVAFKSKEYGRALFYALAALGVGWLTAVASSAAAGTSVAQQINTGTADATVVASATDQAVFYSGEAAHSAAQAFAENQNGILIEQTSGGAALGAETSGVPWAQASPYWEALSKLFANGASGTVHAFVTQEALDQGAGIFFRIELPALQANSKIFAIVLHVIP